MNSQMRAHGGKGQRRRKEESRPVAPQAAPHGHNRFSHQGEALITDNDSTKRGARQARQEGFHMVGNEAIRQWLPILGPNAWAVLSILNTYANSRDRLAWPSLDTLAQYTGLNTTTVRASLVILEATGFIARIPYREAAQYLSDDRLPKKRGRPPTIWLVRALDRLPTVDRGRLEEAIEKARAASNHHIGKYIAAFIQRAEVAAHDLPATVAQKSSLEREDLHDQELPATVAQKYGDPPTDPPNSQEELPATVAPNFPATIAQYSELPATIAGKSGPGEGADPAIGGDLPATVAGEQKEDNILREEDRLIVSTTKDERSLTKSILSNRQQQIQDVDARSDKHPSLKAQSASPVVVDSSLSFSDEKISLLRAWLKNAGIKEPMLSRILRRNPAPDIVVGWILYASTQKTLTNPTGFIVKCLRENASPPEDILPLAHALAQLSSPELEVLAHAYITIVRETPLKNPWHIRYAIGQEDVAEEILDILHERVGEEETQRLQMLLGDALDEWVSFLFQVESARNKHQVLRDVRFPWEALLSVEDRSRADESAALYEVPVTGRRLNIQQARRIWDEAQQALIKWGQKWANSANLVAYDEVKGVFIIEMASSEDGSIEDRLVLIRDAVQAVVAEEDTHQSYRLPHVWLGAKAHLREVVGRVDFNTWFRDARLLLVEEDEGRTEFVVGLSHAFAKEWVRNRLNDVVVEALAATTALPKNRISVRYVVEAGV